MFGSQRLAVVTMMLTIAATVVALPNNGGGDSHGNPPEMSNAPSCGGDKAACCTGDYQAAGEVVSNCITYTPQNSVCKTDSNVYCCFTCEFAIGSCVGCSHFY